MRVQVSGVLAALQVMTMPTPVIGHDGKFPGKGTQRDWKKASALQAKAQRAEETGDKSTAIDLYHQAIAAYPFAATFYLNLGLLYENYKRDPRLASIAFKKGMELDPEDPELQLAWASLLCDQGKIQESITVWRRAQTKLQAQLQAPKLRSITAEARVIKVK